MGLPSGSDGKESASFAGDPGLIPGLGRSPGEGTRYPLQSSGLENSMDCIVHGVAKRQTRLSRFHFTRRDKESICQCRRRGFDPWVREIPWRRNILPTPIFLGFPCGSSGKESTCNVENLGSIPGLGRSPGEGKGYPLQYSGLENSMDCIVHGFAKSQTLLSNFHFLFINLTKYRTYMLKTIK